MLLIATHSPSALGGERDCLTAAQSQKASPGSALKSGQTNADLRAICADYGIATDGKKAELIQRIHDHELGSAPSLVQRLGNLASSDYTDMDANDDGRVTRSEAKAYSKSASKKSMLKRIQGDDFEDLSGFDQNGDGRVTRSEVRMTVNAIKAKLLELGLSTKGLKDELSARLADALDKMSGGQGSPAGQPAEEEDTDTDGPANSAPARDVAAEKESEMGEVVASDATKERTFFPVFIGFAAVLACVAWHLHNLSVISAGGAKEA